MAINLRQRRFIEAYLAEPNGAKAAIAAGYAASVARTTACKLLKHPDIAAEIEAAKAASVARAAVHADRIVVTKDRIIEELGRIAFGDIRRISTWGPGGLALHESVDLDADSASMVSEITESRQGRETRVAVKMHSKMQAITLLAKILGMTDKREADAADTSHVGIADDDDPEIDDAQDDPKGT
ncbi:phage terminase small subunit [Endobacter medicaginis]|uniref:Terminase small subunit n=1 Tax=Endobacter medicaginis TaxID=1181271 RepID=A0A850NRV4_9PROT|nr:terminase small subunit [Endobacter medicaginis]MBB3175483.1 phage terminase small subunit [Endobacter medicaginis]MCX5476726.1 terminase small subunit [Endobacter medicaginis]NVN30035.1 terminase small subunit [Endobacter medicaginis]